MGRISVNVRGDGLAAEIKVAAGPPILAAELQAALDAAKVVHGIDKEALDKLAERVSDPLFAATVTIAKGEAAIPGTDGCVVMKVDSAKQAGAQLSDGHIDFHERSLLQPARADDEIAHIEPPTRGTPGRDVRGKTLIAKPGKPHGKRFGAGVRVDGDKVIALRSGVILAADRQFDVTSLHLHKGDVHLASGNLHTTGSLQVQGDVREGFEATADGDVIVSGAVLDARVTAGGSTQIHHGVLGAGCVVTASTDLACRHATSAILRAGNTIEIGDQATHCTMHGKDINVLHGRGAVFGGELHATHSIAVRTAGTPTGATTLLSVCDLAEDQAAIAKLEAEAARTERLARGERDRNDRTSDVKALRTGTPVADRAQQARLNLVARQRELLRTASVRITETAYPGVVIQFGTVQLQVSLPLQHVTFTFDLETNTIVQGRLP